MRVATRQFAMQQGTPGQSSATLDAEEIDRFARLASEWWDPRGKFRALHRIGPARLSFLRDEMLRHFAAARPGYGRWRACACSTWAVVAGSSASPWHAWGRA